MKMPLHRHLKGLGTLRNQQVARSSRVTSSKPPRKQAFAGWFLYDSEDRTHTLTHTAKGLERTGKHRRGSSRCFSLPFLGRVTVPAP